MPSDLTFLLGDLLSLLLLHVPDVFCSPPNTIEPLVVDVLWQLLKDNSQVRAIACANTKSTSSVPGTYLLYTDAPSYEELRYGGGGKEIEKVQHFSVV